MSDENSEEGAFYYSVMDNEFVYCHRIDPYEDQVCLYRVNEEDHEKSSFFAYKETLAKRYKKVAFLTKS